MLDAVVEHDEIPTSTPGAFPGSVSPEQVENTHTNLAKHIETIVTSPIRADKQHYVTLSTPKTARPSYPDLSRAMQDTAMVTPPQTSLPTVPQSCPPVANERHQPPPIAVQTPGRLASSRQQQAEPQDQYQFTFRAQSLELSSEARQMMAEKREEAARIKQQLGQDHSSKQGALALNSRKMVKGKPRVGRFSDVHRSNFQNMDSIAEQPSTTNLGIVRPPPSAQSGSLKRTNSKADLAPGRSKYKPCWVQSKQSRPLADDAQPASPTKRVKRAADDDVTTFRPVTPASPKSPSTPRRKNLPSTQANTPHRGVATAQTQSPVRRVANDKAVHASQIPTMTPSSTKSPTKPLYPDLTKPASSVLLQSPTRPPARERRPEVAPEGPSLAQSPVRPIHQRLYEDSKPDPQAKTPMLHRSPTRMPTANLVETSDEPSARTPMLNRSPVRPLMVAGGSSDDAKPVNPGHVSKLTERFNQLRRSPVKSILRTPNRLNATPNRLNVATPKQTGLARLQVPMTEPVRKHVNFSASTKGDDGHVFKKSIMPMNIKSIAQNTFSYPKLPVIHDEEPSMPEPTTAPPKFNRRKTLGAEGLGDFTFRASQEMHFPPENEVQFSSLPPLPHNDGLIKARQNSIRQVSATSSLSDGTIDQMGRLSLPTKKRKFIEDQENMQLAERVTCKDTMEDEHSEEARPSKRARPNVKSPGQFQPNRASIHAAKRVSVAPSKAGLGQRVSQKPTTLTQARLAALATPKRR